jgi:hypothetical protein
MKKFFYSTVSSLLLTTSFVLAYFPPSQMGDVVGRSMSSSAGKWLARFGHVGIYDSGSGGYILEVSNESPAIGNAEVKTFTHKRSYWGARYGIGREGQHYKALDAGHNQKNYESKYTFSPYFQEGKWTQRWVPMSNPRRWVQKWIRTNAKFRCDSFVQYCYERGVGTRLVKKHWQTLPKSVFKALPRYRRPTGIGLPTNFW